MKARSNSAALLALTWLFALWLSPQLAGRACAESGSAHPWNRAGLRVLVDTRWLDGGGYRPVEITVAPIAPTTADRTLTVEFLVSRWDNYYRPDLRVVQDVEIPAGSGPVRATLSVPCGSAWNTYTINLLEDGKLHTTFQWSGGGGYYWGGRREEGLPKLLIVADALPDTTAAARLFDLTDYNTFAPGAGTTGPGGPLPTAMARPAARLPRRWIDYTNLDLVCISIDELQALSAKEPERSRALVEWTAAGGNLCVYGLGEQWERLGELESLAGLPPGSDTRPSDPVRRGWTKPDRKLFKEPIRGIGSSADPLATAGIEVYAELEGFAEEESEIDLEALPVEAWSGMEGEDPKKIAEWYAEVKKTEADDSFSFVLRPLGLGLVVAVADEDLFTGNDPREVLGWSWMLNSIGARRLFWYQRHGLSTFRENRHFWGFLIPGVGLPPITAFRVLITLFVLAIGPVNYALLRRWKRLHLLVVTVPLSAAVVTVALFAYAVLADGLGTRVRVRSVTRIDQRRGHAACWVRMSYYAGLAPRGGLRFPDDVAVIPLEFLPSKGRSRLQELFWEGNQRLTRGWLPARTLTQFVTVRSRPTTLKLVVSQPQDRPGKLEVENHLGTRIEELLVRAEDGQYFWASDVEPGATAEAEPIKADKTAGEARTRMGRALERRQPMDTTVVGQRVRDGFGYRSYPRYGGWYDDEDSPAPSPWTGRLEAALHDARSARLEPGGYAAVVERSPEVVLGTDSAREEGSLHVILGNFD